MRPAVALAVLLACATSPAAAAPVTAGAKAFQRGDWTVYRNTDTMTDKVSCTGIYRGPNIQLSADVLFVSAGAPESVTLRFDEEPPLPLRLGTRQEKDLRSAILQGADFERAMRARRLRVQIYTILREIKEFDLDMTAAPEVLASVRSGCPTEASSPSLPPPQPAAVASKCDEAMVDRMLGQGLRREQIAAICRPK